jgi:S-DNA-T family DNA segregation ATPase FtsK/SpoIIIE
MKTRQTAKMFQGGAPLFPYKSTVQFNTYRIAALASSLGLGLLAILLGISIAAALFNLPGILRGPGDFFVRAYSILSFLIPLYLFRAAVILADPRYRPDRIFVLTGGIIPFLTLALGFSWFRNFEVLSQKYVFFQTAGKAGISLITIIAAVIEGLLITLFRNLAFPGGRELPGEVSRRNRTGRSAPGKIRINEIYAEAAAANPDVCEDPPPGTFPSGDPETPAGREGEAAEGETPGGPGGSAVGEDADTEAAELIPLDAGPSPEDDSGEPEEAPGAEDEEEEPEDGEGDGNQDVDQALAEAAEAALRVNGRNGAGPVDLPPVKKKRGPYGVPIGGILNQYPDGQYWIIDDATRQAAVTLKETLKEFNIQAEVTGIRKGPVITMFEILPAPGVKLSRIVNLQDNIALRLAASSVRIVAPIPGKHAVGIEVPNQKRNIVSFREIIEGELHREGKPLEIPVVLGKDIAGEAAAIDLALMPHLLIAGATGSGKSVCVNTMILSILYQRAPAECRLILIDPKIVELKLYNDVPHLLTPVITEPKKAFQALQYCIYEMERRYACLDSMGVRDIRSYNRRIREKEMAAEHMPYIVVVIDEFADLMATTGKELESTVARLAAMSRAVGIHLVLATQRPSIDVITGLIKANIPSRIAFMVASKMDSRIIIDMVGAEKLLGKGDMLYAGAVDPFPVRMQGAFVSEEEVERVVDYVKTLGEPDYIDDEIFYDDEEEDNSPSLFSDGEDPLYEKALEIVTQQGKASASYIQRRLKIGYNRSARLIEEMEHRGVVGPAQGSKPRELLRGI